MANNEKAMAIVVVGYVNSEKDAQKQWIVSVRGGTWRCNCNAYYFNSLGEPCKHIDTLRKLSRVAEGAVVQKCVRLTPKGQDILEDWRTARGLPLVRPVGWKPSKEQLPYVKGSDTSEEAAESMKDRAATLRFAVYRCVDSAGYEGRTCDEVEMIMDGKHQTISPRFTELSTEGGRDGRWLVRLQTKRPTRSGRSAFVYVSSRFAPVEPSLDDGSQVALPLN